jgi:alpha-D-xyloside xylohydrolase
MKKFPLYLIFIFLISCQGKQYKILDDGIVVELKQNTETDARLIKLQVVSDKIIHVIATADNSFSQDTSLISILKDNTTKAPFKVEVKNDKIILSTTSVNAAVSLNTGGIEYTDIAGKPLLVEKKGAGKTFIKENPEEKNNYKIRQEFESPANEAFYGLGENQLGFLNLKGKDLDLTQINTVAVVPFVISNKNYGILWDNYSRSKFGDIREYDPISHLKLYSAEGAPGGLSATYSEVGHPEKVYVYRIEKEIDYEFLSSLKKVPSGYKLENGLIHWNGFIESDTSGAHKFQFFAAGYTKVWIDGKLVVDKWRQCWNPTKTMLYLPMEKGKRYSLKIEWIPNGGESYISLKYLKPLGAEEQNELSLYSESASQINYYFVYGQNMDEIISGYRTITGKANMMPKWAMGFWQSRQRYKTQDELLSIVKEYRKRQIPLDNIVMDWFYWKEDKWGDHEFDPARFHNPDSMIKEIHNLNAHFMISVWPKFYVTTKNFDYMDKKGWLYKKNVENKQKDWVGHVSTYYDAYNPDARKYFWEQMDQKLFSKGVDAWWLDATEPDILSNISPTDRKQLMGPTAIGSSTRYFNSFSLVNAKAVYDGQRGTNNDQRVFILTRSSFAGLQRYSAATWSGDIGARWHDMKDQIPCGLNFSMSGIPYWTMDIGGFAVEKRYENATGADLDEWRELLTRWFQFGAFCPLFRVHGEFPFREIYNIAPEKDPAFSAMLSFDKLRYKLMPYIYSITGKVYFDNYTLMRALVMDFPSDSNVFDVKDQFMFGPNIMVNPVYEFKARSRKVYLPAENGWYDLNSGKYFIGGTTIEAAAPMNTIPIYIKEGAIIPTGPDIQYSTEKTDPVTIYVFTGVDGKFQLYEDENINYNYEKGAFSEIEFIYNEGNHELTIGKRNGKFNGMLAERSFQIVWITKDKKCNLDFSSKPDAVISYNGEEQKVKKPKD